MAATWTNAAAVTAGIQRFFKDSGTLDSKWDQQVAEDLEKAEQAMLQILVGDRGFLYADISLALWPAGAGYEIDISIYFFLRAYFAGHTQEDVPWDLVNAFDRRDELRVEKLIGADNVAIVSTTDLSAPGIVLPDENRDDETAHDYPQLNPRLDQAPPWPEAL